MSNTRLLARQTAAQRLGGLILGSATSSVTAPTGAVTDTVNLLDSGDSIYAVIGNYFMFYSGLNAGVEKRIASSVPSTGAIAVGNNFTSNIVSGDLFEVHAHLAPSEWNRCIDAALRRCVRRREQSVAVIDDVNQYDLSAVTDLVRARQVLEVILQSGATNKKWRKSLHNRTASEFWEDDDVLTLNVFDALKTDATNNLEIIISYLAPYPALASDAATTTCDIDYLTTGVLLQALEWYPQRLEEAAKKTLQMSTSDLKHEFMNHAMRLSPDRAKEIGVRFV